MHALRPSQKLLPPQRVVRSRSSTTTISVAAGAFGFVCGALFWHVIGFWDFVGQVVLKGTLEDKVTADEPITPPVAQRATGSISPSRPNLGGRSPAAKASLACSIAVPDAAVSETLIGPCPPGTPVAPIKPLGKKADLLRVDRVNEPMSAPTVWPLSAKSLGR
jgi:hypothetical protein